VFVVQVFKIAHWLNLLFWVKEAAVLRILHAPRLLLIDRQCLELFLGMHAAS
jgi:hypothetical protein